jgi:hypothetical protein
MSLKTPLSSQPHKNMKMYAAANAAMNRFMELSRDRPDKEIYST